MCRNVKREGNTMLPTGITEKTTQLTDISQNLHALCVVRDAEIHCVGKIPSKGAKRLVACSTESHCRQALNEPDIVAIVAPESLQEHIPDQLGYIISATPLETAYKIHEYLCDLEGHYWEDFDTIIDSSATIHPSAVVPQKNVMIGKNTRIEAGCVIMERTIIGESCKIGPCAVIGADAFEITEIDGERRVLEQAGGVKIGDFVIIQSCTHVARATFTGFTRIDDRSTLDAHIHVAHDCHIKKMVKITACAEISGRVTVEEGAYLGPNCTISNGLTIGKNAKVSLGAVVIKDVQDGQTVSGNFAIDHQAWLKFIINLAKKNKEKT